MLSGRSYWPERAERSNGFQFKRVAGAQDIAPIAGVPSYSPLDGTGSIVRVSEPANSVPSGGQRRGLCEIQEPGK